MAENGLSSLDGLSEDERSCALARFYFLRPFLEDGVPLAQLTVGSDITLRTARRWVKCYRMSGLAGLVRKRRDKAGRQLAPRLQEAIEGLALKQPPLSVAAIHRAATAITKNLEERPPSYSSVYRVIKQLKPALLALAHEGTKSYSDSFDLIHRTEAEAPNAIWQADHTQLDILIEDRGLRSWRRPLPPASVRRKNTSRSKDQGVQGLRT